MMPILPLDGGRVLSGILPPSLASYLRHTERYGFFIVIALLYFDLFDYAFKPIVKIVESIFY